MLEDQRGEPVPCEPVPAGQDQDQVVVEDPAATIEQPVEDDELRRDHNQGHSAL